MFPMLPLLTLFQNTPAENAAENADAGGEGGGGGGFDAEALLQKAQDFAIEHGPSVLAAIAVFIIGRWIAKIVVSVLRKVMSRRNVDATLTKFACSLIYMLLLTLVVISALGQLGVETTSLVAVMGAATLAIGFALQGSLSNFAAGVMLILFRPFKVGDFVEAGGTAGVIEEIGVFATTLKTGDNKEVIVPNGAITGGNIVNYSSRGTRRVDFVFGIGYDDDIKKAKQLLEKLLAEESRILPEPAPTIGVVELADSSVNIACRPWVNTADYWGVFFDMNERVKAAFDENGISIPFPQRDVHMHGAA